MLKNQIQIRDANTTDEEFVNHLTRITMRNYVESTWKNENDREHYYEINKFREQGTKIVLCGDTKIGRISTTHTENRIIIDEIHILPEYQGMGIGSRIIQDVLDEATQENLDVELFLLKVNPVKKLYKRLGFKVYREDGERFYMKKSTRSKGWQLTENHLSQNNDEKKSRWQINY